MKFTYFVLGACVGSVLAVNQMLKNKIIYDAAVTAGVKFLERQFYGHEIEGDHTYGPSRKVR